MLGKKLNNSKGFSILEVLFGITVFMIGMLGVIALNISSLKSNTFSGNMSEAVLIAGGKIEELMALKFNDDLLKDVNGDSIGQDSDPYDGIDDDGDNFGLDNTGEDADHKEENVGKPDIHGIGMYNVYWNVAVDKPLPKEASPSSVERTKMVNVIVEWEIKGNIRSANMSTIILNKFE